MNVEQVARFIHAWYPLAQRRHFEDLSPRDRAALLKLSEKLLNQLTVDRITRCLECPDRHGQNGGP